MAANRNSDEALDKNLSVYPAGSTAKKYQDQDGNDVTLYQLIRREPNWAKSRIVVGEEALQRVNDLEAMLRDRLDLIRCGIGANYSGNPYENETYTSVVELLNNN